MRDTHTCHVRPVLFAPKAVNRGTSARLPIHREIAALGPGRPAHLYIPFVKLAPRSAFDTVRAQ